MALIPRQQVPSLALATLQGPWQLTPEHQGPFTMLVFYRGLHCPICRNYLQELNKLAAEFAERGIQILVASSDSQERAQQAQVEWGLDQLAIGYGLTEQQARAWGLYMSAGRGKTSIGIEEPARFSEPGLFLVRPDLSLYWGNISTMPFARPHFREILGALDFVVKNDYPARGEL